MYKIIARTGLCGFNGQHNCQLYDCAVLSSNARIKMAKHLASETMPLTVNFIKAGGTYNIDG